MNPEFRQRLGNLGGLALALIAWTFYAVYFSPTQGWTFFFQLTVNGIIGQELVQTERDWRLDLGLLAMGGATLRVTDRLGLSAALVVRWLPRPYELHVVPVGKVGETPTWWFGLALDYTLDGKGSSPP